ncbi:host-nuclease inhibitor Gam family protein [Paenibacillus lautus]|uniref:host-nuclease inhibitor Gam family protein n=1 Tax=Paenibacillus lautus TaxID=1401 RepID=UPI001C7D0301|nr:host-nuclease inhibitor Gam family protein [Paenibacillus lautus]MBX4152379.1 host-nuclease inhibitor Gam family protein [Paenibacillus lautus]
MSTVQYQNEVDNIIEDQDETFWLQQDTGWKIDSLELAVWADEKIHEKEVKIAEVEKVADGNIEALEAKIEKLKQWKEESTKKDKTDITFFKEHLHLWHMKKIEEEKVENVELLAKGKKEKKLSKTIKLPYRDLTCKAQQPVILINGKEPSKAKSDDEFVKFVKESNPEFIETKEEVKWGEYKATLQTKPHDGKLVYVDQNGEPIDFIMLKEQGEKYDWKLK